MSWSAPCLTFILESYISGFDRKLTVTRKLRMILKICLLQVALCQPCPLSCHHYSCKRFTYFHPTPYDKSNVNAREIQFQNFLHENAPLWLNTTWLLSSGKAMAVLNSRNTLVKKWIVSLIPGLLSQNFSAQRRKVVFSQGASCFGFFFFLKFLLIFACWLRSRFPDPGGSRSGGRQGGTTNPGHHSNSCVQVRCNSNTWA